MKAKTRRKNARPAAGGTALPASLLACFAATGLTGLVYETVWARMLVFYFGGTQFAITTVLATFMAGLALGSLVGGRIADRVRGPLHLYGLAEIALGLYCLATPALFDAVGALYLSWLDPRDLTEPGFRVTRFALAAAALLLPTTLMGATLPLVARHVARAGADVGARVGLLYAVNTLGAVGGCLATGFLLLEWLGIRGTLLATGLADVAIGIWIMRLAGRSAPAAAAPPEKRSRRRAAAPRPAPERAPGLDLAIPIAFALSGFAALAYEVMWFRVLGLVIGSSVYAFTVMLATFLAGIAAGSAAFAPFVREARSPLRWFAALELVIAFSVLASVPLYRELPDLFLALFAGLGQRFWLFQALQALLGATIMIVPTLCMGALFPTAVHIHAHRADSLGRDVGHIYAWNTVGAIAGSTAAGFALQPLLGVQNTILAVAGLNLALGGVLLLWPEPGRGAPLPRRAALAGGLAAVFAAAALALPRWDPQRMTVGPYVNQAAASGFVRSYERGAPDDELLYYREGTNAIISVRRSRDGEWLSYQANGKWEGTVGETAPNWSLLGHVPLLLTEAPRSALLVGLGTGVTLGAMTEYPLLRIDVVELEPAVVEAAAFFSDAHGDALSDSRVQLYLTDGRTFLGAGDHRYDVIISGVSDPWISGVSNLFTREYFASIAERLSDDGVAAIWFQNYRVGAADLKVGLATLASVFADVSVWAPASDPADLILIARKRPLSIDPDALHERIQGHREPESLGAAGIDSIFSFLNLMLLQDGPLRAWTAGAPLNTDDHPRLEFSLPRLLYTDVHAGVAERAEALVRANGHAEPPVRVPEPLRAWFYYGLASTYSYYGYRKAQAIELFERVVALDPSNDLARQYLELHGRSPG